LRREALQRLADRHLQRVDRARRDALQDRLDLREGLLDRVEVRLSGAILA